MNTSSPQLDLEKYDGSPNHPKLKSNYLTIFFLSITLAIVLFLPYMIIFTNKSIFTFPKFRFESSSVISPFSENRVFRYITLQNDLTALLVSDPDSKESACAVKVNAGSLNEPQNVMGLAHFLEHMLFQGSGKYPGNEEFSDFLSRNNGETNAFTSDDSTVYYFKIENKAFQDGLDIFSHFFIDAKLDKDAVDKEINAVNNEYEIDLQKNEWRFMELLKKLARKENPFHRFTIGNLKTLKDMPNSMNISVYDELKKFYNSYYSSDKMNVCIISNESLDTLEEIANKKFSDVPKRIMQTNDTNLNSDILNSVPAFTKEDLGKFVWYKTLEGKKELNLVFILNNSIIENIYAKSWDYIGDLLNNDYKTGFKSHLFDLNYITNMVVGIQPCGNDLFMYIVHFDLSNEGLSHVIDLTNKFYAYIGLLLNKGINETLYNEKSLISYINFMYKEKGKIEDELINLLDKIGLNLEDLLVAQEVYMNYNKNNIKYWLEQLNPNNALIVLGTDELEINSVYQEIKFKVKDSNQSFFKEKNNEWEIYDDFVENIELKNTKNRLKSVNKKQLNDSKKFISYKKSSFFSKNKKNSHKLFEKKEDLILKEQNMLKNKGKATRKEQDDYDWIYNTKLNKYDETMKIFFSVKSIETSQLSNWTSIINDYNSFLPSEIEIYKENRFIPENLNLLSQNCEKKDKKKHYVQRVLTETNFTSPINNLLKTHFEIFKLNNYEEQCFLNEINGDIINKEPKMIINDKNHEIWYKSDRSFYLPYILINTQLYYPEGKGCLYENLAIKLISAKLIESIQSEIIDANELGYQLGVNENEYGLIVHFYGFSDKIDKLIQLFIEKYNHISINQTDFDMIKTMLLAETFLGDLVILEPIEQAQKILKEALDSNKMKNLDNIDRILELNYDKFIETINNIKANSKIRSFLYGNLLEDQAFSISKTLTQMIVSNDSLAINTSCLINQSTVTKLSDSIGYVYRGINQNQDDINHAIINYYQYGEKNIEEQLKISSFLHTFNMKAFDYLRTERQLGYVVFANLIKVKKIDGLAIFIEGSAKDPNEMDSAIESFLKYFYQYLINMDSNLLFDQLNNALISITEEKTNFVEKGINLWNEIVSGNYDFTKQKYIDAVKNINKVDIIKFYESLFRNNQKKLSIQLFASKSNNESISIYNKGKVLESNQNFAGNSEKIIDKIEDFNKMENYTFIDQKMKFFNS